MVKKEDYRNIDFEYFNVTEYPSEKKQVVDIDEITVVVLQEGHRVQINQLDVFAKNPYQYDKVFLDKQAIIDLAEYLKSLK